jgi:hypothetical protein
VFEASVIHWMNGGGADCGAPVGASVSAYPFAVTCPECILALKLDLLRRRLATHRASVALGGLRRSKRGDSEATTPAAPLVPTQGRRS